MPNVSTCTIMLNKLKFIKMLVIIGSSPWMPTMTYAEMAEDVRLFIDNVIPKELGKSSPVHLLGHSMGGKTAMHLAMLPDSDKRIASLIIEDVAPRRFVVYRSVLMGVWSNLMKL